MNSARIAFLAAFAASVVMAPMEAFAGPAAQDATPASSCEDVTGAMGTPAAMMGKMAMASPMAGVDHMAMEIDQMYIDMMIPHHASIIALAEVATPRLQDERLRAIAEAIIAAQGPEIEELRSYRERFYGDAMAMPMDRGMMEAMARMMPGMGNMDDMAPQMDVAAQVAAICAAEDTDSAFIDLVIPHHQMAIDSSKIVVEQSMHDEVRAFAEKVIAAQQREIDELTAIHEELAGAATPANP